MGIVATPKLKIGVLGASSFEREYPSVLRSTAMTPEAYAERIKVFEDRVAAVIPPTYQTYGPMLLSAIVFAITGYVSIQNKIGFIPVVVAFAFAAVVVIISTIFYRIIHAQVMKSFLETVPELNLLDEPYGFTWDIQRTTKITTTTSQNGTSTQKSYSYRLKLFYSQV
ncbi:hypothetical protein BJ742DRAFT_276263 [Cladochytrium replicatum]|nr:hypothetical protein BJ742DRAFT_276263 [Cladochytrium replicatum]